MPRTSASLIILYFLFYHHILFFQYRYSNIRISLQAGKPLLRGKLAHRVIFSHLSDSRILSDKKKKTRNLSVSGLGPPTNN